MKTATQMKIEQWPREVAARRFAAEMTHAISHILPDDQDTRDRVWSTFFQMHFDNEIEITTKATRNAAR